MPFKPSIGLEIHAELKTNSKMFCGCANNADEKKPNFNICPICAGQPGSLPVANKKAIELVIKTAAALNCRVAEFSKFDRKNYFYPDLPKGYQISQYDKPLSKNGYLEISVWEEKKEGEKFQIPPKESLRDPTGQANSKFQINSKSQISKTRRIKIRRIHLEEDTGKLIHPEGADYSLVDLNRAGAPLMELVTEPDISSGAEAKKFCQELRLIFRYLDVSDADMEKGQMRCEVNISLSQKSPNGKLTGQSKVPEEKPLVSYRASKSQKLGTKVEIKNLNSFKSVERSVDYEIKRQAEILKSGGKIMQETRGWDENKEITFSQRAKEEAHDYRYFPEPDLPPLKIPPRTADDKNILPELPAAKRKRFISEYKLPEKDAEVLVSDKKFAEYFEEAVSELERWAKDEHIALKGKERLRAIKLAANYLMGDIQYLLVKFGIGINGIKITPENFAEFVMLVYKGKISSAAAKTVLAEMFANGSDPSNIIKAKGLAQESGESALGSAVDEAIKNNPGPVGDYKGGKAQALQFLVGQVMSATKGRANPKVVIDLLKKKLG